MTSREYTHRCTELRNIVQLTVDEFYRSLAANEVTAKHRGNTDQCFPTISINENHLINNSIIININQWQLIDC